MKINRKRLTALAAITATASLFAGAATVNAAAGVDMKIGIVLPITGNLSAYGPPMTQAATLGVTQVNDAMMANNVPGSCTVASSEDDQASPPQSVEAANKLVLTDGANALIGPMTSGTTMSAAQAVTIPAGIPLISPAASSVDLALLDDSDSVFQVYPSDALQAKAVVLAMAKQFGKKALVNVGARNDAYGTALAATFKTAWVANGGRIGVVDIYDPNAATYDSDAAKIVSGKPDAFFIIDFEQTFAKVAPALARTKKWNVSKTYLTESFNDANSIKTVGAKYVNGAHGTAAAPAGTKTAAWKKAFETIVPKDSQSFVDPAAYDAAVIECLAAIYAKTNKGPALIKGIRAVSGPAGTPYSWQQLNAAVKAVAAGKKIAYKGAWSEVDFDSTGAPGSGTFEIYHVVNGIPVDTHANVLYKAKA